MNLLINNLPTRTWNHLGMNEALVKLDGVFENNSPEADYDENQVLWTRNGKGFPQGAQADLTPVLGSVLTDYAGTPQGISMEKPLILRYAYGDKDRKASRLVLHAGENSTLKVLAVLTAEPGAAEECALQIEVYGDKNARIELSLVQLLSESGICVNHIGGILEDSAHLELTRLELGAGKLCSGVNLDLRGKESDFHSEIGYHAKPGQSLDMNYVAVHHGPRTSSLMEINGTLEEGSRKVFRGTIDFQKGCAGAKGTENENVLLMGDEMVNQTLPVILCKEEDVEGNHGASIGQLDEKVLFYLGSRGFSREAAQSMIAQARIEAICEKLPDEEIQNQVRKFESVRGISHGALL